MKLYFKIFPLLSAILFIIQNTNAQINSTAWAYQLQNINISEIANNTTFDLIVMDYSKDGSNKNKFTSAEINRIKQSGKKAIAYISIGEAENYRYYWQNDWDTDNDGNPDRKAPAWLGKQNPNWAGNYKVKFWYPEWQNIICNYIDTIILQGFDGIYCDIIDAYYYWSEEEKEEPFADTLMIDFITKIREHITTKTNNTFYIIPQNGEYIIEGNNVTDDLRKRYFSAIDGIGIEDIFFYGDAEENNTYNPDTNRLNVLKKFEAKNKTVLSVEYLTQNNLIGKYVDIAKKHNFIPYATVRALDVLNNGIHVNVHNKKNTIPQKFVLYQNYPNPFNPATTICYELRTAAKTGIAKLTFFDFLGKKIGNPINLAQYEGKYKFIFDATSLASGIYFYRLEIDDYSTTKSMLLIK